MPYSQHKHNSKQLTYIHYMFGYCVCLYYFYALHVYLFHYNSKLLYFIQASLATTAVTVFSVFLCFFHKFASQETEISYSGGGTYDRHDPTFFSHEFRNKWAWWLTWKVGFFVWCGGMQQSDETNLDKVVLLMWWRCFSPKRHSATMA